MLPQQVDQDRITLVPDWPLASPSTIANGLYELSNPSLHFRIVL
jgi:hypothetical protein